MTARALRPEELAGLALAALGHAALVWVLVNAKPPEPLPEPDRVSVTLSEEVGAVSTSPDPTANPEADKGPVLGEPAPEPEPVPQAKPEPVPQPKASAAPPPPRPAPSQAAKTPPPKAAPPKAAPKAAAQPKAPPAKSPPARAGASNFNDAFSGGIPGGTGKAKNPPAAQASAQQVSSWTSLIGSKVRGPWNSCPVSGLDVGKLRASVSFTLAHRHSRLRHQCRSADPDQRGFDYGAGPQEIEEEVVWLTSSRRTFGTTACSSRPGRPACRAPAMTRSRRPISRLARAAARKCWSRAMSAPKADGQIAVGCYLYDVALGQQRAKRGLDRPARRLAPRRAPCADMVYSRLSGESPFFDSRIAYIAETGPKNRRMKRLAIMDSDGANHRYLTTGQATALTPRYSPDYKSDPLSVLPQRQSAHLHL
jgi:hypothetical protein